MIAPGAGNASDSRAAKFRRLATPPPAGEQRWRYFFCWHFAVLLVVIVFFGAIRWRLADMPLERDEGEYAYAGQLILQGIPPYQLAYNMKLPGTYAAYAGILAVFGQTARGIHLGFLLVNAISVVLLYMVTARLFGALAGVIAGASYAVLSTNPGVLGFQAHATHFVVLAALVGLALLLRAEETERAVFCFWSGLAFGIAFLMKQPGILLGIFAFFHLALESRPDNKRERARWAKRVGAFLLGGALPFLLTCALLYRAGVFRNFWFWTFAYAHQYSTIVPLRAGLGKLATQFFDILHFTPRLWIIAIVGVSAVFWDSAARRQAAFVIGLLLFSFAAVCIGLWFRPHYFVLVMPAVAILIAVGTASACRLLTAKLTSHWLAVLPVVVFAVAWLSAIQRNRDFYFKLTPLQECRIIYYQEAFPEAAPVAEYLRQHTRPTDTIMVFGSEPEIYFYSHRHSASGFIYTYSLMEDQAYWPAMQKQMMQEVESNRPAYVVFVNISHSWNTHPGAPQTAAVRAWMNQYISSNFEAAGAVELAEPESHYFWGDEVRGNLRPRFDLLIFKRKGFPESVR